MFEHKQLDGDKCRIIDRDKEYLQAEVLEIRDPKNSAPSNDACRTQYGVIDEVLVERYLPPQSKGDCWQHDAVANPWWNVVGHPPHGGIVADYNTYSGGAYQRTLDPQNNVVAFAEDGEQVTYDGASYRVIRKSDTQELVSATMSTLRQKYYS